MKVIDSHVHLGKFNVSRAGVLGWLDVYPDNLMQYIDEHKLSAVWLLSHPPIQGLYDMNGSEETLGLAQCYSELKPFCQIAYASPDKIGRYVDKGCVGIGEVKLPLPINDPKILAVFKTAKEFGLPVVVHTTDKYCYSGSVKDMMCALDVGANIIWHGWGWWNLLKSGVMMTLLAEYPNCYMDISANSGYKTLKESWSYTGGLVEKFHDRLLYGTDFPMLALNDGHQFGINKSHFNLVHTLTSNKTWRNEILHKNSERLVK